MSKQIDFLTFWKIANDILAARGQSEMLYGEARGYYNDATGGW